jgi:hypothetical protein
MEDHAILLAPPTFKRISKIAWSIFWRYVACGLVITIFIFPIVYFLEKYDWLTSFNLLVEDLGQVVMSAGYGAAIMAHPWALLSWFTVRLVFGFLITYLILRDMMMRGYSDFRLSMIQPSPTSEACTKKDILMVSFAFYWRLVAIALAFGIVCLSFVSPEGIMTYPYRFMINMGIDMFLMICIVLRIMINRSLGHYGLIIESLK